MCLAIPGKIETIDDSGGELARVGLVRFGGIAKQINLSLVPEADIGDHVLVHVGVALQRIDAAEAERVLQTLRELEQMQELP